jgi:hypothetical protein
MQVRRRCSLEPLLPDKGEGVRAANAASRTKVPGLPQALTGCSLPAQFFLKKVTRLLDRTEFF